MSNEMVERVARALYVEHKERKDLGRAWNALPQEVLDEWTFKARIAITAMREPTRVVVRRVERAFKSFEVIAGSATTKEPQWLIRKTDAPGGEWIGLFNSETWARTECDRMNTLTALTAMIDAALKD